MEAGREQDADRLYILGNARMAEGEAAAAEAAYREAIALNPGHAGALNNRGNALRALGRPEEAIAAYRAALALRPEYFGTLNNVGAALLALHRPDEAEDWLRRALAAQPGYAEACNNLGGALLALDRPGEARDWFRRAVALDPAQVQARFGAGLASLALGDFRAGWRDYEARWEDPRFTEDEPAYASPVWRGEAVAPGRTMLVHAEQGLGDTLQFVRYLPLLRQRGIRVALRAQAPLVTLLAPLADTVVAQGAAGDALPPHELRCPLLSLPFAFGTRLATIPARIPYLTADPARVAAWRARLGPSGRPRIGIAVSGSPDHPEDALRSLPAAWLIEALAGMELHVIQTGLRAEDAAAFAARADIAVHAPDLPDFAATAALVCCLDRIVTVDTSLAHLAGGLGRPVDILLQHAADFRWLRGRDDSPWYPSARLYRQPRRGDWATPLARLRGELGRLAGGSSRPGA